MPMPMRSLHLLMLVGLAVGLRLPTGDVSDEIPKKLSRVRHQIISRNYENLQATANLKAVLDPFKSGNENLWIVSVETRGANNKTTSEEFKKNLQAGYHNVYEDALADGFDQSAIAGLHLKAKVLVMEEWTSKQAEHFPDDLVLFLDHDTVYVGCSEKQFLADVHEIFEHSHADMITGAELNCAPRTVKENQHHCWSQYPELPEWAKSLYNLDNKTWAPDSKLIKPNQTSLRYLNSGLVVGSFKTLAKMYHWLALPESEGGYGTRSGNPHTWWNDQHGFNLAYYDTIEGTDKYHAGVHITLDYGARLIFNLYAMNQTNMPFEKMEDGAYKHKLSGKPACFLHGNGPPNGPSKRTLHKIADEIQRERPDLMLESFSPIN